jgi:drug/metabolite transporter (DMT)-like permease
VKRHACATLVALQAHPGITVADAIAHAPPVRVLLLTVAAVVAFAANSILCRLALDSQSVDPATFTLIRLGSGVVCLVAIGAWRALSVAQFDVRSAAALFVYAIAFAFAYLDLGAGTGALILFAAVQFTMLAAAVRGGERPSWGAWAGFLLAGAGVVALVAPGATAPSPAGAALMTIAGIAWGVYSLRGRRVVAPLAATLANFAAATPLAAAAFALHLPDTFVTPRGAALAIASGALASGLGYVAWYAALPRLGAVRAAAVQLSVPAVAAAGGILLLGETLTSRFVLGAAAILGGIAITQRATLAPRKLDR